MTNDEVYAQGLLNKALDPSTQPPAIRSFLREELHLVRRLIPAGSHVLDFGCGMGRHLIDLGDHVAVGVGFDYEPAYIAAAHELGGTARLTNTWGTMSDKSGVLSEMKRLAPASRSRLITVYAATSIGARQKWYADLGHHVVDVTDREIVTDGGFTSEHFTEERLRGLLGPCDLQTIGDIAYVAQC